MQNQTDPRGGARADDQPFALPIDGVRLAHRLGDLSGGYCASCWTERRPCDVRVHLDEMVAAPGAARSTSCAEPCAGVPAIAKATPMTAPRSPGSPSAVQPQAAAKGEPDRHGGSPRNAGPAVRRSTQALAGPTPLVSGCGGVE